MKAISFFIPVKLLYFMIITAIYEDYKANLITGNRRECTNIVKTLLAKNVSAKDIYIRLFQKSLYEIGALWETNKISVAVEHVCASITEGLISLIYPRNFTDEGIRKKVIILCTPGENHQIGAKIVADYFELNNWNSYFLGPDTPYNTIKDYINQNEPDLIAISLSVFFHLISVLNLVRNLNKDFPDIKIIVGGQGLNWSDENAFASMKNVLIVKNLDELDIHIFKH